VRAASGPCGGGEIESREGGCTEFRTKKKLLLRAAWFEK
jgi:hypothetical protein